MKPKATLLRLSWACCHAGWGVSIAVHQFRNTMMDIIIKELQRLTKRLQGLHQKVTGVATKGKKGRTKRIEGHI